MSIDSTLENLVSCINTLTIRTNRISTDISNQHTTAYKSSFVETGAIGSQTIVPAGAATEDGANGIGVQLGMGVTVKAIHKNMSQGALEDSDSPYHMAINGNGFFQFTRPDGQVVYTRNGTCTLDAERNIVNSDGYILAPGFQVPGNAETIHISEDGIITAKIAGEQEPMDLGQIELATFSEPSRLSEERGYYVATAAAGDPQIGVPSQEGRGVILNRKLESSNVSMMTEMTNMVKTHRQYDVCVNMIKKCDQMKESQTRITA